MVVINGEKVDESIFAERTLSSILQHYEIDAQKVAIEKNGIIVPRENFSLENFLEDDRIEIIHFVGGG